jgi:hypothetical protein
MTRPIAIGNVSCTSCLITHDTEAVIGPADGGRDLRRWPAALLHAVDDRHGIGVGLALDRQHHGAGAVEACDAVILDAVDDVGDLFGLIGEPLR